MNYIFNLIILYEQNHVWLQKLHESIRHFIIFSNGKFFSNFLARFPKCFPALSFGAFLSLFQIFYLSFY